MAYEYDVFISYRRVDEPPVQKWLTDSFLSVFQGLLNEELQPNGARVFFDRHDIGTGDTWAKRIYNGLACSKVFIPILIPSYFHREWCLREYAVFHHRQEQVNIAPDGLILPIQFHDGKHFPDYVPTIQMCDFRDFAIGKIYDNFPIYIPFREKVALFVEEVVKALGHAPEWNPSWLEDMDTWAETPFQNLRSLPKPALVMKEASKLI